ncbi:MAG: hypothetical protein J7L26_01560 [Candidatus Aminicenantes bacterium]|nr:hypothetical protein [Candidatus Aminicenantes bacterium]
MKKKQIQKFQKCHKSSLPGTDKFSINKIIGRSAIANLKKFYPEVSTIKNLEEVIYSDPHKLDELPIAVRFIRYLNKTYCTDYVLADEQPVQNEEIDILARSKKNPKQELKIQIEVADRKMREVIGKKLAKQNDSGIRFASFSRITRPGGKEKALGWVQDAIRKKKYPTDLKKGLILLLDGWWSIGLLREKDVKELQRICRSSEYQEIWIIYLKECKKLYPLDL